MVALLLLLSCAPAGAPARAPTGTDDGADQPDAASSVADARQPPAPAADVSAPDVLARDAELDATPDVAGDPPPRIQIDAASDASAPADAADGARPAGPRVPMFVAAGRGGRTLTSCDDGLTWVEKRISSDNADHSEFTTTGFAYGDGTFMFVMGWGYPTSTVISRNGIDWLRRKAVPIDKTEAVAFLGDAFVAGHGGATMWRSRDGGQTWEKRAVPRTGFARGSGGGGRAPGLMFVNDTNDGSSLHVTTDQAMTWRKLSACGGGFDWGNLGQLGGAAVGNGRAVAAGATGKYCTSADGGATWTSGTIPGVRGGQRLQFAAGRFWLLGGEQAWVSTDGVAWERVTFAGARIGSIAASDGGTLVGADRAGGDLFRSTDDGKTWKETGSFDAAPTLFGILFGHGDPSAACPAR